LQYFRYCKSHVIRFAAFSKTIFVWTSYKGQVSTWTVKADLICLVITEMKHAKKKERTDGQIMSEIVLVVGISYKMRMTVVVN
jgi:hypothetical protein